MGNFVALYGTAHFGKSLIWHTSGMLFAFFLTEICAIPPASMGWILACDMIFSAIADAGFGRVLRRHVGSLATAGRLQLPGVAVCAAMLLAFAATPFVPAPLRIAYALATCLSFRLAYSFQDISENAMLYLADGDSRRRIELSSARFVASGLAGCAVAAAASFLVGGDLSQRAGRFLALSLTITPVWLSMSYALYRGSRAERPSAGAAPGAARPVSATALDLPARTATLVRLVMLVACSGTVFGCLLPYFAAQMLGGGFSRLATLALIGLGAVATQPLWSRISRYRGAYSACRAAAAVTGIGAMLFFLGAARHNALAAVSGLLIEAGLSGLSMVLWASFADRISRGDLGPVTRSPTLAIGVFTASIKISSAVALLMISQLLSWIDYHDTIVATSWRLLGPMTIVPFLAGCLCFLIRPRRGLMPA
jgi:Na+/melibiose symporter-like transporter